MTAPMLRCVLFIVGSVLFVQSACAKEPFQLDERGFFTRQGADILVFNNWYNGLFSDSKISGLEIIQHGLRSSTNGDVRLQITPEQWDDIPTFVKRDIDLENQTVVVQLSYPKYQFDYRIEARNKGDSIVISVVLDEPLPKQLQNITGFNLEFLPSAYFQKSWMTEDQTGYFPHSPSGLKEINNQTKPALLAKGKRIVLAPADPERRIEIESIDQPLALYDGRGKAQNGWFVVRSQLPANKNGKVLEWHVRLNTLKNWIRKPVIAHSQVGYHPQQEKIAVIELDKRDKPKKHATLYKIESDGATKKVYKNKVTQWGQYKRYQYVQFDFSEVKDPGLYQIEYGDQKSSVIRIDKNVYANIWQPTLDVFFPVQMDHVLVNEAYRVWHGASHLDDALQAPVDHVHFDLYAQGPTTDTQYKAGEHIPGLNIGGWYDAGDYDIRTQTQYSAVNDLVLVWEEFGINRDVTSVDYSKKYVDLHVADGKPDLLQQIEHGTLALLAQFRAVGHAIPGIIVPTIEQYTHLGDGLTMTDNLVYNRKLGELESNGFESGKFDDRWAFTTETSALNYGSIAALAAASRALKNYNPALSKECLDAAVKAWKKERSREPKIFKHGNTTGRSLTGAEMKAAVELMITTEDVSYGENFLKHEKYLAEKFYAYTDLAVRAIPYFDDQYKNKIRKMAEVHRQFLDRLKLQNPYGVLITEKGWAGNGAIVDGANANYFLLKAFPDLFSKADVHQGLNYILGTHPHSNLSFVTGVGAHTKKVAYGMNRADFSYIPGGVVPGVLMISPDYPENHEDWPFFWGENEYVVNLGASYLFLANAVGRILGQP